jgi:hypothetical protein
VYTNSDGCFLLGWIVPCCSPATANDLAGAVGVTLAGLYRQSCRADRDGVVCTGISGCDDSGSTSGCHGESADTSETSPQNDAVERATNLRIFSLVLAVKLGDCQQQQAQLTLQPDGGDGGGGGGKDSSECSGEDSGGADLPVFLLLAGPQLLPDLLDTLEEISGRSTPLSFVFFLE